jgi:3-oxoacyl-[acyl-carrier protein] reductase
MSEYDDVEALVEATTDAFGGVDVLVNNAGHTIIGPTEELSPEDWQSVIDVDLTGVFFGAQAAGRHMIERGEGGSIVNISSIMGSLGLQMRAPYCASKAGVNNLTRTLAVEWAEHDIRVNALAPGFIQTNITDEVQDSVGLTEEDIRNRTPLRRWGTLEEMANCALFLARRDTFVTGEILRADGGYSAFGWGSWK